MSTFCIQHLYPKDDLYQFAACCPKVPRSMQKCPGLCMIKNLDRFRALNCKFGFQHVCQICSPKVILLSITGGNCVTFGSQALCKKITGIVTRTIVKIGTLRVPWQAAAAAHSISLQPRSFMFHVQSVRDCTRRCFCAACCPREPADLFLLNISGCI